jgi:hypothetical protein
MSRTTCQEKGAISSEEGPVALFVLQERILAQPDEVRTELEPLVEDALEDARFREQTMLLARDALVQFRMDLAMLAFDLEATRREREALRSRLG